MNKEEFAQAVYEFNAGIVNATFLRLHYRDSGFPCADIGLMLGDPFFSYDSGILDSNQCFKDRVIAYFEKRFPGMEVHWNNTQQSFWMCEKE